MSREWKPGDVAIGYDDHWAIRVVRHDGTPDYWSAANGRWPIGVAADSLDYRPLVVIDPEDRSQVVDLVARYCKDYGGRYEPEGKHRAATDSMQTALRSLLPPPCTVFEHYPSRTDEAGTITALCGKVWRRDGSRTVVGRCPECEAIVAAGWVS